MEKLTTEQKSEYTTTTVILICAGLLVLFIMSQRMKISSLTIQNIDQQQKAALIESRYKIQLITLRANNGAFLGFE